MFQSRADSSSETFLTPAQRRTSKICLANTVSYIDYTSVERNALLSQVFHGYKISAGPLSDVLFPIDTLTKRPKGFAFITYMIPENAVTALAQLDGHIFQVFLSELLHHSTPHGWIQSAVH